jgi:hypothetical protein
MTRTIIILAATLGFVGSAIAAETPTMEQCKSGWKSDYSKMWTEDQFTKTCASMMKNGGKM